MYVLGWHLPPSENRRRGLSIKVVVVVLVGVSGARLNAHVLPHGTFYNYRGPRNDAGRLSSPQMYFKKRQIWEEGLAEPVCSSVVEPMAWTGPFLDLSYLRGTLTLTFQCRVHLVLDRDSNARFLRSEWTTPPSQKNQPVCECVFVCVCLCLVQWRGLRKFRASLLPIVL